MAQEKITPLRQRIMEDMRITGWATRRRRLCRKVFQRLSESLRWTQLSGEGRELLERRHTILTELPLADHVRGFDPCQCCGS